MMIEMDRLNAIRLLQALIAAGKDSSAPMAKAWINKKAWEIGFGMLRAGHRARICWKRRLDSRSARGLDFAHEQG